MQLNSKFLFNRLYSSFIEANVQEADQRDLVPERDTRGVDIRDLDAAEHEVIVETENVKPAEAGKNLIFVSLGKFA